MAIADVTRDQLAFSAKLLADLSAAASTSQRLSAMERLGIGAVEVAAVISGPAKVQAQTVRNWRRGTHDPRELDHIAAIDDLRVVFDLAVRLTVKALDDLAKPAKENPVTTWMRSRNPALGFRRPLDLAVSDVMDVIELLESHRLYDGGLPFEISETPASTVSTLQTNAA